MSKRVVGICGVWSGLAWSGQVGCGKARSGLKGSGKVRSGMERSKLYLTNIEREVKAWLEDRGIEFVSQYPLRQGYIADFAILNKKIIIEVDGEHWHRGKKKQKKDRFRDYMLKRAGWGTIRIPEKDIDNLDGLLLGLKHE